LFVKTMEEGNDQYGCIANKEKTKTNFQVGNRPPCGLYKQNGNSFVPWCGFLINVQTFEFQADYTRYHGNAMRASLTIQRSKNPGATLWNKMAKLIKYRCHPLTLDTNINSLSTVHLNVYQAFLFISIKFHLYVKNLPQGPEKNPSFFVGLILKIINFLYESIKHSTHTETAREMGCNCPLSSVEVKWMGLHGFYVILKKKHQQYVEVLKDLSFQLKQGSYKYYETSLQQIVNPIQSMVFDSIIY